MPEDRELTGKATVLEHVAQERRICEAIFDQQNVDARAWRSHRRESGVLGFVFASSSVVLENLAFCFEDLAAVSKGLVGTGAQVSRDLGRFPRRLD